MIFILKLIVDTAIFTAVYLIFTKQSKLDKKIIKGLKGLDGKEEEIKTNEERLKELIIKIPFAKTQEQLDKTGNKFKLNPIKYMVYKVTLSILAFFIALDQSGKVPISLLIGFIGFFVIDILMKKGGNKERALIRLDLEDVYRTLKIKDRRNNKIDRAIEEAANSIKRCNRFREELLVAASTMKLTGQYEKALNDLERKFQYSEVRHFTKAIKSYKITGKLDHSIDGQLNQLEKKNKTYHDLMVFNMSEKGETFKYLYFIGAGLLLILVIVVSMDRIVTQIL